MYAGQILSDPAASCKRRGRVSIMAWTALVIATNLSTVMGQERIASRTAADKIQTSVPRPSRKPITRSFLEPIERSVAASPVSGIVMESLVHEGDTVSVGQPLAVLNHSVLKEALAIAEARAQSRAKVQAAENRLAIARSQLEAVEDLVSGGHTNQFEIDQKQAEFLAAQADFELAKDEIMLAALEVDRIRAEIAERTIRSPIQGFVTEIHKQLGENVSSNDPQYATIVRVDELKVRFYLDANSLMSHKVGQRVNLLIGYERFPTTGEVIYVSPIIDPDSGLGRLDVKVDNRSLRLKSGIVGFWAPQQPAPSDSESNDL